MKTSPVSHSHPWLIMIAAMIAACPAFLQATAIISLPFDEGSGTTTANVGTSGGTGTFTQQAGLPVFSSNVPTGPMAPAGNVSSLDFWAESGGNRAVDFLATTASPTVGLSAFTVTGWVNLRSNQIGSGGNRIISTWSGAATRILTSGFEIVQVADNRLRFSVNEAPDFPGPSPFSSINTITIDPLTPVSNWMFFAVTYDAGDLSDPADGRVSFYFGNADTAAAADAGATNVVYDRGAINSATDLGKSGTLTVGNFTTDVAARTVIGNNSRVLRGLTDDINVFDSVLTLAEIHAVQQGVPEPSAAMLLVLGLVGAQGIRRRPASRS